MEYAQKKSYGKITCVDCNARVKKRSWNHVRCFRCRLELNKQIKKRGSNQTRNIIKENSNLNNSVTPS